MSYGKITPTDLDAVIDFGGQLFVFIEAKLTGNSIPRGQELALERLTDGYPQAIGIVCEHTNRTGVINLANCVVKRYRWRGAWRNPRYVITVKFAVDRILHICKLDRYLE